ncbi:MAG: ankyrin repeat domain-containing protein [bacterium]
MSQLKRARIVRSSSSAPKPAPLPTVPVSGHTYSTGMLRILIPCLILAIATIVIVYIQGNPPSLNEAADDGDLAKVRKLLRKGYNANERDSNGYTPLMWVAGDSSKLEIVKELLDKGADVNARADDGRTPLTISCFLGNIEVVKLLLAKGANMNVTNKQGVTPLQQAATYGRTQVADLLRQYATREQDQRPQNALQAPATSTNSDVEIPIEPGM